MNGLFMTLALILLIIAITSIATSSIGIQCYNKCNSPDMNKEMPKNKSYLVINLVLSILLLLIAFPALYYAWLMPALPIGQMINAANTLGASGAADILGGLKSNLAKNLAFSRRH
jgi:formate hydrogenlyase subunit 3/multisubunit Na+/H+ antiporter MnhD subunit